MLGKKYRFQIVEHCFKNIYDLKLWLCGSSSVNKTVFTLSLLTVNTDRIINHPTNTKHLYNIYTTSAQRLRRWSYIV